MRRVCAPATGSGSRITWRACSARTAIHRPRTSRRRPTYHAATMRWRGFARDPRIRWYVTVNPNYTEHALAEIEHGVARGAIGVKLLASRRADDPLLDPVCEAAARHGLPILHHIWQHRTREWPNQEISDGADLARLAERHPRVAFVLAHIGGGGDWAHTLPAVRDIANVYPDLSGSGVDRGMLDAALAILGARRLLWACDLTIETGLAKLRALDVIGLSADEIADIRWRNAARLFPHGAFPRLEQGATNTASVA